ILLQLRTLHEAWSQFFCSRTAALWRFNDALGESLQGNQSGVGGPLTVVSVQRETRLPFFFVSFLAGGRSSGSITTMADDEHTSIQTRPSLLKRLKTGD